MKKRIALLLAAVLCFSLAACGEKGGETGADGAQEPSAASAASAQDADATGSTKPQKQTIEITLDNWQEYFEINRYLSLKYYPNDFNEPTDNKHFWLFSVLELKEKYSGYSALGVTVQYDVDYFPSDIVYNLENFSFQLTDCVSHPEASVDESDFVRNETTLFDVSRAVTICHHRIVDGKVVKDEIEYNNEEKGWTEEPRFGVCIGDGRIEENEDGTGYISKCPTNIRITRIEGTLKYDA